MKILVVLWLAAVVAALEIQDESINDQFILDSSEDEIRFKRSPDNQPWEVKPGAGRDENGNVNAGVEVKNKGKDHEFEAGWNKVVRGPNRAKPTWHVGGTYRFKRSPDNQPWEVKPGAGRDENGNVNAGVEVKNKGKDHEFEAGWNKVVRGPNRAKPTWHVGGTYRFKRSPDNQPWEVKPGAGRDENGNVIAGVEVKNKGKDHEFEAGWNKVVRGPNRAKPTWHVGGTYRFKRSPDNQPWEVKPGAGRDENGNVNAGVEVKNKGKDHEFEAGWNKVVRGPNRAKPTWHVGGTIRFKRSPDNQPWEVKPGAGRDENGNVIAGVEVKNKGKDHEFEAGWNKVVRGPNRAKPTWHVGGTYRFKRSPDNQPWEVKPGAGRDENGNVNAGVEVKNKGKDHEFEAGWNKVVRGPNRAKPTWHVGGTYRFKRSPDNQPWEVKPGAGRDENGNVIAGVEVKNKGKDHEFEAGWNKVVRGPNRAKPTWHVGGTYRFKRSPDNQPWEVKPGAGRDENGNVIAGVEVKNKGKDHEFEAGWNKVVRGPNRAKPTWHVGGTYRFKRSIELV